MTNVLPTAKGDKIPDVPIRVLPLHPCDFDWQGDWIESTDGTRYRGYQGTDIMVASSALAILALATNGRMTPKRIWKLAMDDRQQSGHWHSYSFAGIDYYEGFQDGRGDGTDTYPNHFHRVFGITGLRRLFLILSISVTASLSYRLLFGTGSIGSG